jgi:hypothetical protein
MLWYHFFRYQTVESIRNGLSPNQATQDAILRIVKRYPEFTGALVAIDKFGNHGKKFCFGRYLLKVILTV